MAKVDHDKAVCARGMIRLIRRATRKYRENVYDCKAYTLAMAMAIGKLLCAQEEEE